MGGLDRRILIPCDEQTPAAAAYATMGGETAERQEAGPQPGVVERDSGNLGGADLRMARRPSAPVLRHLDAEVRVHVSGDLGQGRMIWRRQGDPHFKGKSDYCDLAHSRTLRLSTAGSMQHPRLLAMSNGELLVVWAEHASSSTTDNNWQWKARVVDPRNYALGAIATLPTTNGGWSVDRGATTPAIPAIDVAEDPSRPGHVVAVGVAEPRNLSTTGSQLKLITFTSRDYGRTWQLKAINDSGDQSGDHVYGVAVEYVGERLACLRGSVTSKLIARYSNDHGATWSAGSVGTQPTETTNSVDVAVTVNGALLAVVGSALSTATNPAQAFWSADGGATWTIFTDSAVGQSQSRSVAVGVDDSGYPYAYSYANIAASFKSLFCVRSGARAITLVEVSSATSPLDGAHQVEEQAVIDNFTSTTKNLSLEHVAATTWRGRVAVALYYSDTAMRSLTLHFAGQWADLRYSTLHQSADSVSSWFWLYLPMDFPDVLGASGYAWTTTGTVAGNTMNEDHGLELVDSGAAVDQYTSPALPADPYVVRVLARCLVGGSTTADTVMLQVANATSDTRYGIRLATTGFQVRDVNGAANVGPATSTDLTQWHEFVFVTFEEDFLQCYWRRLDPSTDGEHPAFNELLADSVGLNQGTPEGTNLVTFFHASGANARSQWRQIAQQRAATASPGPTPPNPPVVRWDPDSAFQLYDAALTGGEYRTSDKGPQIAEAPMDLADGACVAWSGAAALAGNRWFASTRSDFGLVETLRGGPTRAWRSLRSSLLTGEEINLVYDAGEGRRFRADAIAIFGCNWPDFRVQMNDADSWSAPPVDHPVSGSTPGSPTAGAFRGEKNRNPVAGVPQRYLELVSVDGCAVTVKTIGVSPNVSPFGPHQYRSQGTRRWYLQNTSDDTHPNHVWEVADCTEDTLFLTEDPDGRILTGEDLILTSDRVLVDLTSVANGVSGSRGWRFLRLTVRGPSAIHTPDGAYRLGRVVLGRLARLTDPEWGFSVRRVPNVAYAAGAGGQVRAAEVGPALEAWALAWARLPPTVRDDANAMGDTDVWERLRDLFQASGMGLRSAVLVPDAGALGQASYYRASGDALVLGRLTGVIDQRHEAYWPVEECGNDALDHIGPMMAVAGFTFQEEA